MRRKKISPVLLISWMILLMLGTFLAVSHISTLSAQRLHGRAIRQTVFEVNDLTDELEVLFNTDKADSAALANLSGRLLACITGTEINDDYTALVKATANTVYQYACGLSGSSELSPTALDILKSDAVKYNGMLHDATQYVMSLLQSNSEKKMDKAYFEASLPGKYNNELITSYVKSLQK